MISNIYFSQNTIIDIFRLTLFYSFFRAHKSMYHSLGFGTFAYLQAIMTFDPVSKSFIDIRLKIFEYIKKNFCDSRRFLINIQILYEQENLEAI